MSDTLNGLEVIETSVDEDEDEYEYYTGSEYEEEEEEEVIIEEVPIIRDSAWRKRFQAELDPSDSGRDSLRECELEERRGSCRQDFKRTPLHTAVLVDDVFKLRELLDQGSDPNAMDHDGIIPLHLACMENRQNLVLILLGSGADGSIIDTGRRSPLHYAVKLGFTKVVQSLLEYDTYLEGKDRNGQTVLHVAALEEHTQTLQMLISRANKHGTEEDVRRFINMQNRDKQTALHIAAERGYCDIVQILLNFKADLSICDQDQATALHLACGSPVNQVSEIQVTLVIRNLIKNKASIQEKDEDGLTPLLHAARAGRTESAKILVKAGASINTKDTKGLTVLHYAASKAT